MPYRRWRPLLKCFGAFETAHGRDQRNRHFRFAYPYVFCYQLLPCPDRTLKSIGAPRGREAFNKGVEAARGQAVFTAAFISATKVLNEGSYPAHLRRKL